MQKNIIFITALLALIFCFNMRNEVQAASLPDINKHWAKADIQMLVDLGIVEGRTTKSGQRLFFPEEKITRAEFVVMLVNAMQIKPLKTEYFSYQDVGKHWARPFIEAATEAKLTGGVGDGLFEPDRPVTRTEIAVMIVRAKKWNITEDAKAFADVEREFWAYKSLVTARSNKLIFGDKYNRFLPFANATRAETAAMIARMLYIR